MDCDRASRQLALAPAVQTESSQFGSSKATRSFNANTRLETLLAAGGIEPRLYDALQAARKYRNDTAHGAHVDLTAATTVLEAMRQTIEFVCDRPVAHPYVQQFVLG